MHFTVDRDIRIYFLAFVVHLSWIRPFGLFRFGIKLQKNFLYTFCRTPWNEDRIIARPVLHNTAHHWKARISIHARNGIWNRDPSVRAVHAHPLSMIGRRYLWKNIYIYIYIYYLLTNFPFQLAVKQVIHYNMSSCSANAGRGSRNEDEASKVIKKRDDSRDN
jgi:hypothetical protein